METEDEAKINNKKEIKKRLRRERYELEKAKMAADPEYAKQCRERQHRASSKYRSKKKTESAASSPFHFGKPGRIVARWSWK